MKKHASVFAILAAILTAAVFAAAPGALRMERYNDEGTALAKPAIVPVTALGLLTTDAFGQPAVIAQTAFVAQSAVIAETVRDQNTGAPIKRWYGTQAQYDAIATKDAHTEYNIYEDE